MFKITALALGLLVGCANGAVITSGTISFGQNDLRGSSGSVTDFLLGGSEEIALFRSGDGDVAPTCDAPGAACLLTGLSRLAIGSFSGFNPSISGYLQFSYTGNYLLVHGLSTQTFRVPFTASGGLHFADPKSSSTPCPFAGVFGNPCDASVIGSGTATSTVTQYYGFDEYYVSQTVYSFTQTSTPEPSTWLLLIGPSVALILQHWRRRIRAGYAGAVAGANNTLAR